MILRAAVAYSGRVIESQRVTGALHIAAERAQTCGFFFDFDGTLSTIQTDPSAVTPVPGAVEAIADLAPLIHTTAIVSGRPVGFLQRHFGGLPVRLYGLYGMESADEHGTIWTDPEVIPWIPAIDTVARQAMADLDPQILVEHKRLSVALHYRTAPHLRDHIEQWGQAKAVEYGLTALPGRMVVELKPPVRRDKGDVIATTTTGLTCAWYFGDDLGDLPALHALDRRAHIDPDFAAFCVGIHNPETGDQVADWVDLVLDTPADLVPLLRLAARAISTVRTR